MRARYSRLVISYTLEMQLPRVYFAHEVPILEALHGADGVRVEEDNVGEAEIDPRTELRRLKVVYKDFQTDDGLSVVDAVFPDGTRDLEAFYNGTYVKPDDMNPAGVLSDDLEAGPPVNPEREKIFAELDELGVEYSKTAPTAHLKGLLAKYREEALSAKPKKRTPRKRKTESVADEPPVPEGVETPVPPELQI